MTPMMTSIRPSPIDRGGKMKWKLAVSANWTRESVSASTASGLWCLRGRCLRRGRRLGFGLRRLQPHLCGRASALDGVDQAASAQQMRHDPRPAGLVRGADPGARVAVEVFVEPEQVVPVRVGLELLVATEHGPAAMLVVEPDGHESAGDVLGDVTQPDLLPGAGRELDPEVVAHERIPVPEGDDDQVVGRHPDRATPVRVAAEETGRRFARLVVDRRGEAAELELERLLEVPPG